MVKRTVKNTKRPHCPPFHRPDITNAFRVKRNWSVLESACFSGVSRSTSLRIYHFAVIGKLRFVPIEITISRFSNWPRTEVTNHISKRESSRLYMRSGENPFCFFNYHHSVIIPSFLSPLFPPLHLSVSLAFLILTDSKPRMYERVYRRMKRNRKKEAWEARWVDGKLNKTLRMKFYEVLKTRLRTPLSHNAVVL